MSRHNNKAEMTVGEIIEDVKEQICDDYCKYTEQYRACFKDPDEAQQRLMADMCEYCPMCRL